MNIQNMIKQAQKMQKDLKEKKEKINSMVFIGKSSLVTVEVSGKKEILKVEIDKSNDLSNDDIELLQDMIVIALNDAFKKVDAEVNKELGNLGGLNDLM